MENFLLVGLGGAVGAMGRYALSLLPNPTAFPVWTLLTNLLGALLIGFLTGWRSRVGENAALFWKTGVCGGFTTFSTFSLEAWTLLSGRNYLLGGASIILSLSLCLAGVLLGQALGRRAAGG